MVRYSKQDALNEEERKKLISKCKSNKERLVVVTLMYTGLRVSEFCSMKSDWIDWQNDELTVKMKSTKTKKHGRTIPLLKMPRRVLSEWFRVNEEIGMHRTTAFKMIKRVAKRIDGPFKKVYPHSLRATFASLLAQRGMSAPDVQDIVGWKKLETANNYVKAVRAKEEFREKMEGVE